MLTKLSSSLALVGLLIFVALLTVWIALPSTAWAQCGDIKSTCANCHQVEDPVCGITNWHSVFGHRYACWNCHGGNDTTLDKEQAHVGLERNPLDDTYTSCYACHPEDYQQRAAQLAKTIGVAVFFREPVAPASPSLASVVTQPLVLPQASLPIAVTNSPDWIPVLWLFPLAVLLALGWFVWKRFRSSDQIT